VTYRWTPQPSSSRDLPYRLTWSDLEPVLGPDTSGWSASTSYEKQGLDKGDNSCILTLQHAAAGSRTVFIKHIADQRAHEASRYRLLASLGVPTPTLLATISRDGTETVVLEFLPRIGIDLDSPLEVREMLELVARLNATNVGGSQIASQRPARSNDDFDQTVLTALRQIESVSMLRLPIESVFDAYKRAQSTVADLPLALNHGEFYFQQVGWASRGSGEELVVFDLATLALRPRFWDVAGILPLLVEQTGQPEAALFGLYLDALADFGKPVHLPSGALREVKLTRVTGTCWSLPWLVRVSTDASGSDLRGELALKVRWLCDDVEELGFIATG
jgi:hypothetical protein